MIVIAGTVRIRPEKREEAVQAAVAMAEASRAEAGCVSYGFWADLVDPATFLVFEEWESEEALARHFQTEHMRVFRERLPTLVAGGLAIKRYAVASASPM
jgi:quinol monooxygenase YgiN